MPQSTCSPRLRDVTGWGAQSVTRTAERLQTSTEQAGKGIQESFTEAVTRLKDVYAAAA